MAQEGGEIRSCYSWDEFDRDIGRLAAWIKERDLQSIYGIPRGGLIAAVALSHRTGLSIRLLPEEIDGKTLVVDDISDSGNTLIELESKLKFKPQVATLFYHKNTRRFPDFALREKTQWVIFPWETKESSKYDRTV